MGNGKFSKYLAYVFFIGLILFFISLIFSLIRYPLIELAIFIIGITISTLLIYLNSKSLYEKYIDMKIKQDNLKNKDSQKNANNVNLSQNNSVHFFQHQTLRVLIALCEVRFVRQLYCVSVQNYGLSHY